MTTMLDLEDFLGDLDQARLADLQAWLEVRSLTEDLSPTGEWALIAAIPAELTRRVGAGRAEQLVDAATVRLVMDGDPDFKTLCM